MGMIKITPYYEHKYKDKIMDLYWNLIALVTSFYPEDVFPDGKFRWQDTLIGVEQFDKITGRRPRNRTEKYIEILENYEITKGRIEGSIERRKNDALLAKSIIREKSARLYEFLYEGIAEESGHVNKENFHLLLTVPMNRLHTDDYDLNFEIADDKELLSYVFCYEKFSSQKELSQLLNLLGVEVCPYCNRTFITTLEMKTGSLRAQIDHYKSKSKYPHLALSILNLIPSCRLCNHIKRDNDLPVLYPYAEEMGDAWGFEVQPQGSVMYLTGNQTEKDRFVITGKWKEQDRPEEYAKRLENSLEIFKLEKLYNSHKEHVLDLFRQRYIFGEDYLKSLCDRFPDLFHSVTDVKNTLYLSDIRKEKWGKRPLSKLTHDIDEEFSRLEQGKFIPGSKEK